MNESPCRKLDQLTLHAEMYELLRSEQNGMLYMHVFNWLRIGRNVAGEVTSQVYARTIRQIMDAL